MLRKARLPWKVRSIDGALLASCITKRGAETEQQLSDVPSWVTHEPYEESKTVEDYSGQVPQLTLEYRSLRVQAWNEVAEITRKLMDSGRG